MRNLRLISSLTMLSIFGWTATIQAQSDDSGYSPSRDEPMSLAYANQDQASTTARSDAPAAEESSVTGTDFLGISEFYNIREANPNIRQGAWEFQVPVAWVTQSGTSDKYYAAPGIKYGVTDDMFVLVELAPMSFGDGGHQANGDISVYAFNRFARETDQLPALAAAARVRIPSGQGSSGVDGELYGFATKKIIDRLRAHFNGFVITANGERGGQDTDDRRHFQWGFGPGFDYQIDDQTIALLNYLMQSNPEYGEHNQNILEIGGSRTIAHGQDVKLALDIGLDGQESTPNIGVKLQYSIAWK